MNAKFLIVTFIALAAGIVQASPVSDVAEKILKSSRRGHFYETEVTSKSKQVLWIRHTRSVGAAQGPAPFMLEIDVPNLNKPGQAKKVREILEAHDLGLHKRWKSDSYFVLNPKDMDLGQLESLLHDLRKNL